MFVLEKHQTMHIPYYAMSQTNDESIKGRKREVCFAKKTQ